LVWLTNWTYRKSHIITGSSAGAQTNYQLGFKIYYGTGSDGTESLGATTLGKVYCDSKCKTDLEIYDSLSKTELF
jgi:hypothetical protein